MPAHTLLPLPSLQKLAGQRDGISKQAIECYELLIEDEAPSND